MTVRNTFSAAGSQTPETLRRATNSAFQSLTQQLNGQPRYVPVPASATSNGRPGDYAATNTHFYICTAANTWRRVAIATWED